jgi:hypothetical protein
MISKVLQPWPRLIAQTLTGLIVAVILTVTDTMGVAFGNTFLNYAISVIWIVGVCNSINFFDNHDGGAAGTVAVISLFLFFIAFDRQQILVSALAIVTAGATAGFLIWNRHPAKIYMGDAGALFLGIIISVLTIRLSPGIIPQEKSFAIPALINGNADFGYNRCCDLTIASRNFTIPRRSRSLIAPIDARWFISQSHSLDPLGDGGLLRRNGAGRLHLARYFGLAVDCHRSDHMDSKTRILLENSIRGVDCTHG